MATLSSYLVAGPTGPTGPAGASVLAASDRSMGIDETVDLTLSTAITTGAPVVSAMRETSDTSVRNYQWRVDTNIADYDLNDTATATTLTPNKTAQTVTLGSGSFSTSDIGKVIRGNGGWVTLASTSGDYIPHVSDFTDNSIIASGDWIMVDMDYVNFDLTIAGIDNNSILTGISRGSNTFSANSYESAFRDLVFKPDGTEFYFTGESSDRVHQVSLSTAWDLSTATYTGTSAILGQESRTRAIAFKSDGTKLYLVGDQNSTIYQYSLSTAWDITTVSYDSVSLFKGNYVHIEWKPDGTKLFTATLNGSIQEWGVSTAWDISTISTTASNSIAITSLVSFGFANSGENLLVGTTNDAIGGYELSTAYDLSTAISFGTFQGISWQDIDNEGSIAVKPDFTTFFTGSSANDDIGDYTLGTSAPYRGQWAVAVTNSKGQIKTDLWTSIASMSEVGATSFEQYYAYSIDNHTTWKISTASGERNIVRNNSGTWEYNSNATYASTTWTSATINTEHGALEQALSDVTVNRMNIAGVYQGYASITLGNTFDLAIILNRASLADAKPDTRGLDIDYNAGAVYSISAPRVTASDTSTSGDYTAYLIDSTTLRFRARSAGNYKIRVI